MSSRNAYLSQQQRRSALVLSRSLAQVKKLFEQGERCAGKLGAAGRQVFSEEPSVRLDYFQIVNPETLEPVESISAPALVAVAAFVGGTRLIDNIVLAN